MTGTNLLERFRFKLLDVGRDLFAGQRMPFEIQQRRRQILECFESLVEFLGTDGLVEQGFGDLFPSLLVPCIVGEDLRLNRPVFLERGREFHEITGCRRPRNGGIGHIGKHAMKRMTHFMNQGRHIIKADERRFPSGGTGNVEAVHDHRLFMQ